MNLPITAKLEAARNGRRKLTMTPVFWREMPPARRRALVWPREHGAWGIFLVALITGGAAGFSTFSDLPRMLWLTLAATAAFCLRTPIENSLPASPLRARGSSERRWVSAATVTYALSCALGVGMLVDDGTLGLIWKPAIVAAGLFGLRAVLKRWGRHGRLLGEITGAFGLGVVAVAAWSVAAGRFDSEALVLWLMNGLFAANQILYVQLRLRETRLSKRRSLSGEKLFFLAGEALIAMVLIAGWQTGLIPGLAVLGFLPILARGGVWSFRRSRLPLRIHRVGKTELVYAILFGILVIAGFRLSIP